MMLYTCVKFHQNIWNHFQLTKWTRVHSRNGNFQYLRQKGCDSKFSRLPIVTFFLCSASCVMVLNTCERLHQNVLNCSQFTERTRVHCRNDYFNVQRAITPTVGKPGLQFMCFARCFIVFCICVKFPENILNNFQLTVRTQVHGRNDFVHCSKDNNSKRRQTRITVHVFCMSSSWCLCV